MAMSSLVRLEDLESDFVKWKESKEPQTETSLGSNFKMSLVYFALWLAQKNSHHSQPRTCKPQTSRDLFPRIFSCSRHLSSNRLLVTSILLAYGLIWCWFYNPQSRCAHHRLSFSFNTLYILTSVCIFSILFSTNFQRCWRGEFV